LKLLAIDDDEDVTSSDLDYYPCTSVLGGRIFFKKNCKIKKKEKKEKKR